MNRFTLSLQIVFGLAGFVAGMPAGAFADPVDYSESIDGDLSTAGLPLDGFILDAGDNKISGTFGWSDDSTVDFDSFAFTVPVGMEMYAGLVTLTDVAGDIARGDWWLRSGSDEWNGGAEVEEISPLSPGFQEFASAPLGPGLYNLSTRGFAQQSPNPALADFSFTLKVRPQVPETHSHFLVLVVGAVAFATHRNRSIK